ncbi:uncharacterized protein LOC128302928 [Anopheles moucheti]|uniref:uncharacterized protein LOC128302928 n=1 Tax=Anopheles moucheti TaxID=186751 RepID=UPI0022F04253|nr:uncharacterized protein LOC128302928 [Anopheles moucheti]
MAHFYNYSGWCIYNGLQHGWSPELSAVIHHHHMGDGVSQVFQVKDQDELPDEWKLGVIHPVYKKGDRLDCANFRAITALNAAYKILSRILFCRLARLATDFVGNYQAGFVGGKSTTDQIFTLGQILQKCREHQIPTHHLFIDFKAAYDTIDRTELWNTMQQYGFPGKLVRLLRGHYGWGAVQGFADDIDIIGRTSAAVCEAYTRLKRVAARIGLRINATKTKYLLAGSSDRDRTRLGSRVSVDGDDLKVVVEFCYLGTIVTSDNNVSSHSEQQRKFGRKAHCSGKSCILRAPQTPAIQKAPATHEMHNISHTDTSGSPLWP